jgi:DNA-binding SARP family transcriptional activator/tetratricopeptide (TPR) repeat protein
MLRDNRFRLVTLGRLTLIGTGGEEDASLARRRLKLAVLTVLALARRPVARDTLLGLFWAEHDEPRARHSLSNALSSLRGALGERSITTRDAEVSLDPGTPLDVDVIEFIEALENRDYARAVEVYAGGFLEGFHVDESPAFEQWVARERRRLESLFTKASSEHCASLARARRWTECEQVANRWLEMEPLSGDAAIYLLNAIKSPGTRAALAKALEEFEALRTRLNHEFELAPHPSVMELSTRIREQLASAPPEPVVNIRVTQETKIEPIEPAKPTESIESSEQIEPELMEPFEPAHHPAPSKPARPVAVARPARKRTIGLAVAVTIVLAAIVAKLSFGNGSDGPVTRPVIAVLPLPLRGSDSASAWLTEGLPEMINGKLAGVSAIEVVPPAQVSAVVRRRGRQFDASLPEADARDLARRVGASLVAHGSLARDGQNYVLDLAVRDVRGALVRSFVLTHADPLSLADQAAQRILGAANVSLGGPRVADVETSSLEAYQLYISSLEHGRAGRFAQAVRDIEAAIALDSGFIPALRSRLSMAIAGNDTAMSRRLRGLMTRYASRATEFDRRETEIWESLNNGERERSEALARELVRRYPRDPRGYSVLVSILMGHGAFQEAERFAIAGLGLDSLAIGAGTGPCEQCVGFFSIIALHWYRSDWAGAKAWGRRWIAEQPDAPAAWSTQAWTYFYGQQPDSALPLMHRVVALSGSELWTMDAYARMLLANRRYAAAESVVTRIESLHRNSGKAEITDLRSLLAREHGRFRESTRIIETLARESPEAAWFMQLIVADNKRLLGDYPGAFLAYERLVHGPRLDRSILPAAPGEARAYCWHHALGADALGPQADTVLLRGIADTLESVCKQSYFGRDWGLYHQPKGLIAMRGGRYAEAEAEFSQAIWTNVEGWGRPVVELARARMAAGRPLEAVAALRPGYATRLDAMGRYVPISELDYWMSVAFAQAGQADSARVYAARVEEAWRYADPEFRRQFPVPPGTPLPHAPALGTR